MSVIKVNGVEVHAAPGEVVVVNGVRVEVQHSGGGKSPRAAPLLITDGRKGPHGREPDAEANQVIIDCLEKNGPLDAGRLLDTLGIDPKDHQRKLVGQRMSRLIAKGVLRRIKSDRLKGRPRYEVTPKD